VLNKKTAVLFIPVLLFIAIFMNGSAAMKLAFPAHQNQAFHVADASFQHPVPANVRKSEIKEIRIKIRYMGSECSYSIAPMPYLGFRFPAYEVAKFLQRTFPVNIYFLDSFHLRGPPSVA